VCRMAPWRHFAHLPRWVVPGKTFAEQRAVLFIHPARYIQILDEASGVHPARYIQILDEASGVHPARYIQILDEASGVHKFHGNHGKEPFYYGFFRETQ
jgi:hypothetical protein